MTPYGPKPLDLVRGGVTPGISETLATVNRREGLCEGYELYTKSRLLEQHEGIESAT